MKTILAGLVGGAVLFVWGFLAWAVLPIHMSTVSAIANEDAVVAALQPSLTTRGVYFLPTMPPSSATPEVRQAYEAKYRRGPVGMIIYSPEGMDPMMARQMIIGFVISFLSAALVAWFLTRSTAYTASYFGRVAYCGMFGIFLAVAQNLMTWNWLCEPNGWATGWVIDSIVGWTLVGLVIAAMVKQRPAERA
jgi:hypothetical protein